jgi:hypothetical protein
MTTSPRLGYTELTAGQAVPETTVNEIGRYLEQGASKFIFKSKTTTAEPGSPADGDCYLLTASPTGTHWSTQANKIAFYENTAWVFLTAREGYSAWVNDTDLFIVYDGTTWQSVPTGSIPAECTDSELWTGTSTTTRVSPRRVFSTAAEVTLTDGATVTPDFNTGLNFKWTIGGNRTLANPTNAKSGQSGLITITQDGTGSRIITYGSNWKFPGGAATGGVLSTTASAVDSLAYFVRADGTIICTLAKAFS